MDHYLLPQFASDVAQSFAAIKAHCLQSAVAQHLDNLGILLAVLFEDEFSLLCFVFILTPSPVFTSLTC